MLPNTQQLQCFQFKTEAYKQPTLWTPQFIWNFLHLYLPYPVPTTNPSTPLSLPPSMRTRAVKELKPYQNLESLFEMSESVLIPTGCQYRGPKHHLSKPTRFHPAPLSSSGSLLILFLFTELVQLHSYNVMDEIRSGEFSWNMEEVSGGTGPAPAVHQYSVCAAALSGILGIQLGWGKNNCHCFFSEISPNCCNMPV